MILDISYYAFLWNCRVNTTHADYSEWQNVDFLQLTANHLKALHGLSFRRLHTFRSLLRNLCLTYVVHIETCAH